ncbi:uncharacterized protein HPS4 [Atheta coriaria]|uniref:uncharacterized protein HPS4 n=1 Tax=Dalotia coriaria TaxID=877792 RepID=UPI0031F362C8
MAKEMMIIFVYDTQLLKHEGDDPASAILYFHPGWVSDQQKTALCGQIMGTAHFLKSVFACPRIISLQSGKFSVQEYGRYILAVGTDRNIADWVLEYRADTLSSLITFFHNDIAVMSEVYPSVECLSAKLYHMFETYIKILTYSSNLFSNIPKIHLPKSASNVFLESMQILQCCQEVEHVLGGTMLYHNKVLATQLSSNLTKRLVLTDPYRIKSPAETVEVDYQLPLGVQLLHVYVEGHEYQDLSEDALRTRTVHLYLNKRSYTKSIQTKEPVLSAMKRDQSIIFSNIPEEDTDAHSPINIENNILPSTKLTRPKFLNLRNKTLDEKPAQAKVTATTPFYGQTSICSTPMTDLNKVLHQSVMSICIDPEHQNTTEDEQNEQKEQTPEDINADITNINDKDKEIDDSQVKTQQEDEKDSDKENGDFVIAKMAPPKDREARKSLTLPLKSLTFDSDLYSPIVRSKNYGGVQLTPLMSKLSLLAMDEHSSGFGSRDTTPSEYKDVRFTTPTQNKSAIFKQSGNESKFKRPVTEKLKKSILFVCGQQDMVVGLLLEENAHKSPEAIQKLWGLCTESLGKLEKQLRHCLETYPGNTSGGNSSSDANDPYSYLSMDQHWDTIQRGGPWGCSELGALTHLHRDFCNTKNITEITLR